MATVTLHTCDICGVRMETTSDDTEEEKTADLSIAVKGTTKVFSDACTTCLLALDAALTKRAGKKKKAGIKGRIKVTAKPLNGAIPRKRGRPRKIDVEAAAATEAAPLTDPLEEDAPAF